MPLEAGFQGVVICFKIKYIRNYYSTHMTEINKKEPVLLFLGDIFFLLFSLWLMLAFRYGDLPSVSLWYDHAVPFSLLFIVWVIVFFIAGLYEKHTVILRNRLPNILLNAQIANSTIAVLFFYFIPYFGITPKVNLFIYLFVSFGLLLFWRIVLFPSLGFRKKQNALLIGSGEEMKELKNEVNNNSRYNIQFISSVDLDAVNSVDFQEEILKRVYTEQISIIAIDLKNEKSEPILPQLYNLIFSKVRFIDMHKIYEDIFDRVPLSLVQYNWFIENISISPKITYDFLKRVMDLSISLVLGIISLLVYPFVWFAIKLDDKGDVFIIQRRIGQNGRIINIPKFRTMQFNEDGVWVGESAGKVTRVGKFLRQTRIDELPQLWSVIKGDLSLIGPRPDISGLGSKLSQEIPYYTIRNLIKPGLSGWAQIKQEKPPQSIEETRLRLAYDIYYIKNRSFILDSTIVLKTIKTLLSRVGI
jgi:lipopolysaccharide/colanic/teichoic acid biosynthesis glycosyltransferase